MFRARKFYEHLAPAALFAITMLTISASGDAQTREYPKEIRGYKVARTVVEVKRSDKPSNQTQPAAPSSSTPNADGSGSADSDVDQLITFGKPQVARVTPLGITFEVPIVVAPVKQSGRVDFLLFQDMVVNGRSVEIDEYHRSFNLPNKTALTLREPLRIYIYLTGAMLAALGEWSDSNETWQVTGRVYVFGSFKKGLFSFKRCIPVEVNLTIRNPLREK
jgi:hypothetical protein